MTIVQPPRVEIEKLIRSQQNQYGARQSTLAFVTPTLEEVTAAIAVGPRGTVEVYCVDDISFMNVVVGKKRATLQYEMRFQTLKLNLLRELEVGKDGAFSFVGSIRTYDHEDYRPSHNGEMRRGYSAQHYRVKFDPHLTVHSECSNYGFGHGTEYEGYLD